MLRVNRVELGGRLGEDCAVLDERLQILRGLERAVVRPRAPRAEEEREVRDDRCGRRTIVSKRVRARGTHDVRMIMNGAVRGAIASQKMEPFLWRGVRFSRRARRCGRGDWNADRG